MRNERITELHRRICYNQTIYDDALLEATEYAGLTLRVRDLESMGGPTTAETVVGISHAAIRILDDESKLSSTIKLRTCNINDSVLHRILQEECCNSTNYLPKSYGNKVKCMSSPSNKELCCPLLFAITYVYTSDFFLVPIPLLG